MTTPDQHKIDQGRQRTLDERLAERWPGCMPTTNRNPNTGARRTTFARYSRVQLPMMELYVSAYNEAMEDARHLIRPPVGLEPVAKPDLAAGQRAGRRDGQDGRSKERQRAALAGARALFRGGKGNG